MSAKSESEVQKTNMLMFSLGFAIFSLSMLIALHPGSRKLLRTLFDLDQRKVLSTATGNIVLDKLTAKVVKVRTGDGIFIEVYAQKEDGNLSLISKLQIPDVHDGYFSINGESSNLIINDIDGDNIAEIIAPSFDKDLIAHLNIYKYDPDSNSFFFLEEKK